MTTIEERAARLRVGHCKVCEGCPGKVERLLPGEGSGGRHSPDPCNCITRTTIYAQRDNPTETALDALALAYDVLAEHPTWTARASARFAYNDIVRRINNAGGGE